VNFLAANTDVVVDDISFHIPPFDGTSAVSTNTATALNTDANPIRGYFTAVANLAFNHWGEPWTDSGQNLTLACPASQGGLSGAGNVQLFQATANTKDATNFGPSIGNFIQLPNGSTLSVMLAWNDPFSASTNDYDLFLYSVQNNTLISPLACSVNPSTGTQPPVEHLTYTNNSGATQQVGILVQNSANAAAARNFDMFIGGIGELQNLNFYTVSGSVPAQADAGGSPVSVVSVGATDAQIDGIGNQPGTIIESFSSQGPTNATPQSASRMKPDVTAADGVSVTGAGGFGFNGSLTSSPPCALGNTPCTFFGTSAASPHAAAIAALVLQAAPCLRSSSTINKPATARANLRNFITSTAAPLPGIAQTVPNNIEGFGLVNALNAITATLPTVKAGSDQTITGTEPNGLTVNFSGSASDPNSCPVILSWSGSCGTATGATASLTCPIGNNTETLTASNGGVTASIPTGTVHVSVTDFSVVAQQSTATVKAGVSATYTISVGSQFGAFSNPVSLACSGTPSLASCSLSMPSVTPGSSSATSTLTITTTASSSFFPVFQPRVPTVRIFVLWLGLILALAVMAIFARNSGRERGFAIASYALVICLVVPILSCGGGSSGPHNPGTPVGTYSITVTGSSNQLQHSTTVILNVQ
jgi:Subtilase family